MTIQDLLNAGFEMKMPITKNKGASHYSLNTLGTSYNPDWLFVRGNKSVKVSRQGCLTEYDNLSSDDFDKAMIAADAMSVYFIELKEGDNIVYRNHFGIFPSNEVLNTFIS